MAFRQDEVVSYVEPTPSANIPSEFPGLRRFVAMCGYGSPEIFHTAVASAKSKQLLNTIKRLIGKNIEPEELKIEINVPTSQTPPDPEDELVIHLLEEIREHTTSESEITVLGPTINEDRLKRIADILGIDPAEIQGHNLSQLLLYFSDLSKRVDELVDFSTYETSLQIHPSPFPEISMLETIIMQAGLECVLYATLNLASAAKTQNAFVEDVSLEEMNQRIPKGEGTSYRILGVDWINYLKEKGFAINNDFNWGEAFDYIKKREGGLVLRIFEDHAIAVVGVRFDNSSQSLQFLVANSLSNYWPYAEPGKPVWVNAKEVISKTVLLKSGETGRIDNYLVTWKRVQES